MPSSRGLFQPRLGGSLTRASTSSPPPSSLASRDFTSTVGAAVTAQSSLAWSVGPYCTSTTIGGCSGARVPAVPL